MTLQLLGPASTRRQGAGSFGPSMARCLNSRHCYSPVSALAAAVVAHSFCTRHVSLTSDGVVPRESIDAFYDLHDRGSFEGPEATRIFMEDMNRARERCKAPYIPSPNGLLRFRVDYLRTDQVLGTRGELGENLGSSRMHPYPPYPPYLPSMSDLWVGPTYPLYPRVAVKKFFGRLPFRDEFVSPVRAMEVLTFGPRIDIYEGPIASASSVPLWVPGMAGGQFAV